MAEDVLVGEQLTPDMVKSGELVVAALDKLGVMIRGAFWLLLPEQRVWRLVVAAPEARVLGPRAIYRKIRSALARLPEGVAAIGIKDISVVDERNPVFLLLRSVVLTGPGIGGIRLSRNFVNGQLIEDAYLYRMT